MVVKSGQMESKMEDKDRFDGAVIARRRKYPINYLDKRFSNICELADFFQIPHSVALARLELGWPIEKLIRTPHEKEVLHAYWRNQESE